MQLLRDNLTVSIVTFYRLLIAELVLTALSCPVHPSCGIVCHLQMSSHCVSECVSFSCPISCICRLTAIVL